MGLWSRLFGGQVKVIDHPEIGRIKRQSKLTWESESVPSLGCRGDFSVTFSGCESGPLQECLETYKRLRRDWKVIAREVAETLFELNQNYCNETPKLQQRSLDEVWESAELVGIDVNGDGEFSLTFTCDWQAAEDGHLIVLHFEHWRSMCVSIDG